MFAEFVRRQRLPIAAVILLLLVNIAVFVFFTQPKLDSEAFNRRQMEAVEQRHAELSGLLAERREFLGFLKDNDQALETFYTDMLGTRRQRLTSILASRENISSQFGIVPTQVRYNLTPIRSQPLERFSMSFPLVGSYESFRFFIDTLEGSDHFLIIDDIELDNSNERQNEDMNMRIQVSTMFHDPDRDLEEGVDLEVNDE